MWSWLKKTPVVLVTMLPKIGLWRWPHNQNQGFKTWSIFPCLPVSLHSNEYRRSPISVESPMNYQEKKKKNTKVLAVQIAYHVVPGLKKGPLTVTCTWPYYYVFRLLLWSYMLVFSRMNIWKLTGSETGREIPPLVSVALTACPPFTRESTEFP